MRPGSRRRPLRRRARRSRGGRRRHAGVTGRTRSPARARKTSPSRLIAAGSARPTRAPMWSESTGASPVRSATISAIRARSTSHRAVVPGPQLGLGGGGERRPDVAAVADDPAQERGVLEAERDAAAHRRVRARPRVAEADTRPSGGGLPLDERRRSTTPPIGITGVIGSPSSQCAWRGHARTSAVHLAGSRSAFSGRSPAEA